MNKSALIAAFLLAFVGIADARCYPCAHRSSIAKREFKVATGHPYGWPGHIIDHVRSLKCGGADFPTNMQWQTIAEAKAKNRWENIGCK